MASKELDTNEVMTRDLMLSGVQNLAISDESLTQEEETQLVTATRVTLGETENPAVEVGQDLRGTAEEVDGLLNDVREVIDSMLDEGSEVSMQKLTEFFMAAGGEVLKNGVTKGAVMITVMVGYALIRRYLKRYINEDILTFIEKMASFLYQIFMKYHVLDWIMQIGGWKMFKSMTSSILSGLKRSHWAIIGSVALLITGVSAYNFIYT